MISDEGKTGINEEKTGVNEKNNWLDEKKTRLESTYQQTNDKLYVKTGICDTRPEIEGQIKRLETLK